MATRGSAGWRPITGYWDANGTDSIGLYSPSTAAFFLKNTNSPGGADVVFTYGPSSATPLAGDWNGDGRRDLLLGLSGRGDKDMPTLSQVFGGAKKILAEAAE
mgnify:CR=1 FL=1